MNQETKALLEQILKTKQSCENLSRLIQLLENLKSKLPPDKLQKLIDQLKTLYRH